MIKKIRTIITSALAVLFLAAPAAFPAVVAADDISGGVNCGSNLQISQAGSNGSCEVEDTSAKMDKIIKLAINIFSLVVGIIAVVMIIIGGLKYTTSGGDSGNITGAKNTIIYAIVGLVVVALAQFIVHFVLTKTQTEVAS